MSRPPSALPTLDHQRHDELLVAQFAMGDSLPEANRSEAQRMLATCGACAALAADLRAVAGAVAREPVPPRRRDFRLASEQAERLRGNALSRLLRRSSLPRSRALGPAAAGVFSVGLAFVVVGYAWPDDAAVEQSLAPMSAPALLESYEASPAAGADARSIEQVSPAADELMMQTEEGALVDEAESFMAGGESVLGASAAEAVDRDAAQKNDTERLSPDDAAPMAEEPAARAAAPEGDRAAPLESPAAAVVDAVAADAVQSANDAGSDLARAPAPAQGPPLEAWLMAIGAGLAVLGALLLLLAALARQVADPLLR